MKVVIDASALLATVLPEQNHKLRDTTSAMLAGHDLMAPPVWPVEIVGGLAKAEWMQRISSDSCDYSWSILVDVLGATEIADSAEPSAILPICRQHKLRGADATYLELALRFGVPLLTGDKGLARAARAAKVDLIYDPQA